MEGVGHNEKQDSVGFASLLVYIYSRERAMGGRYHFRGTNVPPLEPLRLGQMGGFLAAKTPDRLRSPGAAGVSVTLLLPHWNASNSFMPRISPLYRRAIVARTGFCAQSDPFMNDFRRALRPKSKTLTDTLFACSGRGG